MKSNAEFFTSEETKTDNRSPSVRKNRLLAVASAFTALACGFIFCRAPSGEAFGSPIADALICSCGAYTPFSFLGVILGKLYYGTFSVSHTLSVSLAFILRIVSIARSKTERIFSECIGKRLSTSAALAVSLCIMNVAQGGVTPDGAISSIVTLLLTPAVTLIFSVYFIKKTDKRAERFIYELSAGFLYLCTVYSCKGIDLKLVSADTLTAVFITLAVARYGGFVKGALMGFVLGYVCTHTYFFVYPILGGCAGALFSFGVLSACGISAACACGAAMLYGGAQTIYSLIPDLIVSCAISAPILRYGFVPSGFPYPSASPIPVPSSDPIASSTLASLTSWKALRDVSDGLKEISKTLPKSKVTEDHEEAVKSVCESICERCPLSPICLESNGEKTKAAITEAFVSGGNIPAYLSERCIKMPELTECVKELLDRTRNTSNVAKDSFSISYSAAAHMLTSLADSAEAELVADPEAEETVSKALRGLAVPFSHISVVGRSRRAVYVFDSDPKRLTSEIKHILSALKRIFGSEYALQSDPLGSSAVFTPTESIRAEAAFSSSCKAGEEQSGDTVSSFTSEDGVFYALIADGMGSGKAAERCSSVTAELIKKMMLCRMEEKSAIRLAGEVLSRLGEESFSTVDLLRLDLVSGKARVTKNHAAASYVLRNGAVYCCDAASLPVGITDEAESESTVFTLTEGDTVVMVSDGVASGPTDKVRITDVIGLGAELSPKDLADAIIKKAVSVNGRYDDMSAVVIKIRAAA